MIRATLLSLLVLMSGFLVETQVAAETVVTVSAQDHPLGVTPVVTPCSKLIKAGNYLLIPKDRTEGTPRNATVFGDRDGWWLGFVLSGVPAGSPQEFTLVPYSKKVGGKASAADFGVGFQSQGANLLVTLADKPWTTHIVDQGHKPFLYPLIGPTGANFTRHYPMRTDVPGEPKDHPHQRSFWFTHGSVNGVDFWAETPKSGKIRETERITKVSGSALGVLRTKNLWVAPDGKKVCEDERIYRFYHHESPRLIDFEVTVTATEGPLVFGDTKEGSFGVRVASTMDVDRKLGGKITNAEGKTDKDAWGKASPWVDYTGPVEGKTVGIAIFNHPDSLRAPTTWHVRTYGLFAANPFGWKDFGQAKSGEFTLEKGKSAVFAYRILLHEGATDPSAMSQAYTGYATPPRITVQTD